MVRQVLTIKSQLDFQLSILQTHQVLRPLTTTPPPSTYHPSPLNALPRFAITTSLTFLLLFSYKIKSLFAEYHGYFLKCGANGANECTNGVRSNISSLHHFLACLCLSLPIQGFFYFIQPTKCGFRLQNYFPWIPSKS